MAERNGSPDTLEHVKEMMHRVIPGPMHCKRHTAFRRLGAHTLGDFAGEFSVGINQRDTCQTGILMGCIQQQGHVLAGRGIHLENIAITLRPDFAGGGAG